MSKLVCLCIISAGVVFCATSAPSRMIVVTSCTDFLKTPFVRESYAETSPHDHDYVFTVCIVFFFIPASNCKSESETTDFEMGISFDQLFLILVSKRMRVGGRDLRCFVQAFT